MAMFVYLFLTAILSLSHSLLLPTKYHFHSSRTRNFLNSHVTLSGSSAGIEGTAEEKVLYRKIDREFAEVALPAFVSLAADPLASLVDAMYVGRLTAADQAGMGIAVSAQFSVAKLYNDPLLKTSTSLVAGTILAPISNQRLIKHT